MRTINKYSVRIIVKSGCLYEPLGETYDFNRVEILGENKNLLCLNDDHFTHVHKKKESVQLCLGVPSISSNVNDNVWGTSLRYTLYTENRKRKATIAREIREYIENKYGGFGDIDLSFLEGEANESA